MKLDVLAFGPHPDDIEFACGGTLSKLASSGKKVGIIDMSHAELSTNGDVSTRIKEADKAKDILGASIRENLGIENNFFFNSKDIQKSIINTIREYKPVMVFLPYYFDRHPDHEDTSEFVRQALFTSGLVKYKSEFEPHRPKYVFFYMLWYEFKPSFVVDITDQFSIKMNSILAYNSQFSADPGQKMTIDNDDRTLKYVEARARNYGFQINKTFGEPFLSLAPIGLDNPFDMIQNFF